MGDLLVVAREAPALDIEGSDPLCSIFRFNVREDEELPQQGQFFVLHETTTDSRFLMQRLPLEIPDNRLSCVKPEPGNIRAAMDYLYG